MKAAFLGLALLEAICIWAPTHASEQFIYGPVQDAGRAWLEKYGKQIDYPFSGPLSFSHLQYARCLQNMAVTFDIAVLGMPFGS
jgi:agmatinase